MSTPISMPEFDQLADIFWRLGVMQSPAQLQGFLIGQLAVGEQLEPKQWLQQAVDYIDAVQPPSEDDSRVLLALYVATAAQVIDGELNLQLLLPDDAVELPLRVDAISQWCQGFMVGFAAAGKERQQTHGQQQYSSDVSEALSDIAAISQVGLGDDDDNEALREQHIFDISEYLRLAAITIYLDCHPSTKAANALTASEPEVGDEEGLASPKNLFTKTSDKLH